MKKYIIILMSLNSIMAFKERETYIPPLWMVITSSIYSIGKYACPGYMSGGRATIAGTLATAGVCGFMKVSKGIAIIKPRVCYDIHTNLEQAAGYGMGAYLISRACGTCHEYGVKAFAVTAVSAFMLTNIYASTQWR